MVVDLEASVGAAVGDCAECPAVEVVGVSVGVADDVAGAGLDALCVLVRWVQDEVRLEGSIQDGLALGGEALVRTSIRDRVAAAAEVDIPRAAVWQPYDLSESLGDVRGYGQRGEVERLGRLMAGSVPNSGLQCEGTSASGHPREPSRRIEPHARRQNNRSPTVRRLPASRGHLVVVRHRRETWGR